MASIRVEIRPLTLRLLPGTYAVCRLASGADADMPTDAFRVVIRSESEVLGTTVVCYEPDVPQGAEADGGWHVLVVEGVPDFGEVGVLTSVLVPLADAGVASLVACSFETDYVLVKAARLDRVARALTSVGHTLNDPWDVLPGARA